jgi:hypothetical protein
VLHLHIDHKDLLPEKRKIIENLRSREDVLTNKNVLVVDDDVRNLFALTTAFERIISIPLQQKAARKPSIFW